MNYKMEKILFLFLLVVLVSPIFAANYKEYRDKYGNIYKKEYFENDFLQKEELFLDGLTYIKEYLPSGSILHEGSLITKNIRHGEWKYYSPKGSLEKIEDYSNGILVLPSREIIVTGEILRVIDHFPNGEIKEKKSYLRTTLEPMEQWETYASENSCIYLQKKATYTNHELESNITFYPNNTTKSIETYRNGEKHEILFLFDKEGNPYTQYYYNGIAVYENGQIKKEYIPIKQKSNCYQYYEYAPSGNILISGIFENGKQIGIWRTYINPQHVTQETVYLNNNRKITIAYTQSQQLLSLEYSEKQKKKNEINITLQNTSNMQLSIHAYGTALTSKNYVHLEEKTITNNTKNITIFIKKQKILCGTISKGIMTNNWHIFNTDDTKRQTPVYTLNFEKGRLKKANNNTDPAESYE